MPVSQYFRWVGSFLLGALFVADWCFSGPIAATPRSDVPLDQKIHIESIRIINGGASGVRHDPFQVDAYGNHRLGDKHRSRRDSSAARAPTFRCVRANGGSAGQTLFPATLLCPARAGAGPFINRRKTSKPPS